MTSPTPTFRLFKHISYILVHFTSIWQKETTEFYEERKFIFKLAIEQKQKTGIQLPVFCFWKHTLHFCPAATPSGKCYLGRSALLAL
ncbi:hypothetical protein HMPREF3213_00344 [Heyndrickxia coagulans]|uniref:Uncharacterized protein n=1 Tax=Heyndrickxia coagulans TaxID=1398 RepID=A0A133L157_HEYCO|nr:hypothetical protein HMPREF3213_00344 [Heyndrickxia coagulans]